MTTDERKGFIAELRRRLRLGDKVESVIKPVARALRLKCLDADGKLKPDSGCAKRRDRLNGG